MDIFGILLGIVTLFIIGLGFPLVIQIERRLGYLWWPFMMGLGIVVISASLLFHSDWISAIVGVFGATLVWASTELKEQAIRARLGWFPFYKQKIRPPLAKVIEKWRAPHL